MPHLILVRHGQSEWNLEKKFTGWVDVDLTGQGKLEACKSGEYVKELRLNIDYFYSSFQLRAINTLKFTSFGQITFTFQPVTSIWCSFFRQ